MTCALCNHLRKCRHGFRIFYLIKPGIQGISFIRCQKVAKTRPAGDLQDLALTPCYNVGIPNKVKLSKIYVLLRYLQQQKDSMKIRWHGKKYIPAYDDCMWMWLLAGRFFFEFFFSKNLYNDHYLLTHISLRHLLFCLPLRISCQSSKKSSPAPHK